MIQILDGGLGMELVSRSKLPATPLWSVQNLIEEPDQVTKLHGEFIRAGARIITMNSYALTPQRLARHQLEDQFTSLQKKAWQCAVQARMEAEAEGINNVRIAACLPPLVASYHPETHPHEDEAIASYRRMIDLHLGHVDIFLAETMSSLREVDDVIKAADIFSQPLWLACTVQDQDGTKLRSGESVQNIVGTPEFVSSVLLNCSYPEAISDGLDVLLTDKKQVGAYANGFRSVQPLKVGGTVDVLEMREDLSPAIYADFATQWQLKGISIIGGCCGIGPSHIEAVTAACLQR